MRVKTKSVEVPDDDIYRYDELKREDSVSNLSRLISNVQSPLVLSINAPWGAGKTTFLKMMHANLKANGVRSVYFSAWETDFAADPLLAFLGEINGGLAAYLGDDKRKAAWESVKKAGAHILKRVVPVAVKVGTAGLIDADKIIEDEASGLAESFSIDLVESYAKNKEAITVFKTNVRKILEAEDGEPDRLCVFVDELDRCRPTYAIELLERIKHLLDIEGLVFVLALDKGQLAHSIKAVYGGGFDASGYLKRFIDIEFNLPDPDRDNFVAHLFEQHDFTSYFASSGHKDLVYDGQHLLSSVQLLSKSQKLSLRSIEQLFTRLKLVLLSVPTNQELHPELTLYLIYLRDIDKDAYDGFVKGGLHAQKSIDFIEQIFSEGMDSSEVSRTFVHSSILAAQLTIDPEWVRLKVGELKEASNSNLSECEEYYARRVVELYEYFSRSGSRVPIKSVLRRVEMLDDFIF